MSNQQTVLDRELFIQALRHMSEEDLRYLNRKGQGAHEAHHRP